LAFFSSPSPPSKSAFFQSAQSAQRLAEVPAFLDPTSFAMVLGAFFSLLFFAETRLPFFIQTPKVTAMPVCSKT